MVANRAPRMSEQQLEFTKSASALTSWVKTDLPNEVCPVGESELLPLSIIARWPNAGIGVGARNP